MHAGIVFVIVIAALLLLFWLYACCTCYVVREGEAVIIERLGRFHRILTPGVSFVAPLIDSPREFPWQHLSLNQGRIDDSTKSSYIVDTRENIFHFNRMEVYTRDTLLLEIDAVMYYRISDVFKAIYEIDDLQNALMAAAQTQVKEAFGHMTFHEALQSQDFINEYLVREFGAVFEKWGVQVYRLELLDLRPGSSDSATSRAMKLQMIAERQRRGDFIKSDADKAFSNIIADGTKRVDQIYGLAEQESTKKLSEGQATSTVLMAEAEQAALNALAAVTKHDNTSYSEFYLTKKYIEFLQNITSRSSQTQLVLPIEPFAFSGILKSKAAEMFGRNRKEK